MTEYRVRFVKRLPESRTAFARANDDDGEGARCLLRRDLQAALAGTRIDRKTHAICRARARCAFALIEHYRQLTRVRIEPLHRIFADANADRQERAKAAMHTRQEPDPLVGCLGGRRSRGCDEQHR